MLLADFCQFGPHSIVLQTTLARAFVASITRPYADCEIRAQVIYLHGFEIKGGPILPCTNTPRDSIISWTRSG